MARPGAVDVRPRRAVRLARADRRRLARGARVHPRRALPALGVGAHARRHAAVRRRAERRRQRRTRSAAASTRRRGSTCSTPAGPGGRRSPASCSFIACGWVVLRPERVIDPTTQLPAIALPTLAVMTLGLSPDRRRPRHPRRAVGHRPRPGDGGVARRRRAAGARRAGRSRRGGPRARRARVRSDLGPGDRRHRRQRPRPAVPPRRRLAVQRAPRAGAAAQDGPRGGDAVRRADRPPGRPGPAGAGPRPVHAHGRPAAPGVRHRGGDRRRRARR